MERERNQIQLKINEFKLKIFANLKEMEKPPPHFAPVSFWILYSVERNNYLLDSASNLDAEIF